MSAEEKGEVLEGELTCAHCGSQFPIRRGTPRFVGTGEDYCGNFGFQWQRWKAVQIDRHQGHRLSERALPRPGSLGPGMDEGKLILDAGCGAGRFSDVAAAHGADRGLRHQRCGRRVPGQYAPERGARAHVQASLYSLPFREHVDAAFCFGVIQHTPDPAADYKPFPA